MNTGTNKQYTEYFFVHGDGEDFPASGGLFGTGTSVNLNDGQLGLIFGRSYNGNAYGHFILAADTPSTTFAPVVKLVQGTSNSADFSNLYGWHYDVPAFSASPEIRANTIQRVSSKVHGISTHSTVALDGLGTPASNTRYAVNLKFRSVRKDRDYGGNVDQYTVDYTTGDLSAVSNKEGKLLMAWGMKINLQSKQFPVNDIIPGKRAVMALAIDSAGGGAGTTLGTAQVGDSVNVFTYSGTTYAITLTKEHVQTFNQVIANVTGVTATSKIEAVDIDTPGATDTLLIMGLTHDTARADDDIYATKVRVEATVNDNLTATITEGSFATEDEGDGRNLKIWFDERAFGQTGNTQLAGFSDQLITPIEYIDETARYTTHVIDTIDKDVINNDHIHNQTRIWILMLATDDSVSATVTSGITVTTQDTSALSDLNGIFGAWLLTNDPFQVNGDSTTTTLFA